MATLAQTLRFDGALGSRLVARAPHWLAGILIVLIGVRLALLLAQLAGAPPDVSAQGVANLPPPSRNMVDIQSIVRAGLFGESTPAPSADAPVTSLPLVLGGVFAYADDENLGYALLGNSSADIKFYKVGDSLPGGVRLHAVQADRVLLNRGGGFESLMMAPRTTVNMAPPPPLPGPSAAASINMVQDIIRDNPGILGQVIQRQQVFVDGRLQGMRVSPGANAQAFNRLGLRSGDLVTAINGMALVDQTNSAEVFNTLSNSPEARVTVTRNGVQQELLLNLAEIAQEAGQLAEAPPPDAPPGPESAR